MASLPLCRVAVAVTPHRVAQTALTPPRGAGDHGRPAGPGDLHVSRTRSRN